VDRDSAGQTGLVTAAISLYGKGNTRELTGNRHGREIRQDL
jgi:hypothetical protein